MTSFRNARSSECHQASQRQGRILWVIPAARVGAPGMVGMDAQHAQLDLDQSSGYMVSID
jgi:hypothetical protein